MATFPTPAQIQTQYFQILQSLKPSLNVNDQNSDFVIRGNVFAGFASGLYGDQARVDSDTYISTSSPAALTLHGADLGIAQNPATQAESPEITVMGTNGVVITPGQLTFQYPSTGVLYTNTSGGTITGGTLIVSIQATSPGQIGNVAAPDTLNLVSPPSGVNSTAAVTASISDGTDAESTDAYRAALLNRIQQPPSGGNANDYRNFAFAASPSVVSVVVNRFGRGLGTVDLYITTGTTDIDTAVTNGLAIVRVPSQTLLNTVQAYLDANAPLTDCPMVYGPTEATQDVTLNYILAPGITLASIPSDPINNPLGLTVAQLLVREVGRALYKVPVGGWLMPGFQQGFVVVAYIEESLDVWLSSEIDPNTGTAIGIIPILANRQVQMLNPPSWDMAILANEITAPGTITTIAGGIDF